jgi:hypothetical protein
MGWRPKYRWAPRKQGKLMSEPPKNDTTARCSCGSVELEAIGAPIMSAACYCDDCQEGARQIEALPNARPVRDPDGGTPYLLYPKDRVNCSRGAEFLQAYKIKEKSATNRVVATCCNSAMFLNFEKGIGFGVPSTVSGRSPTAGDACLDEVQAREQRRSERLAQLREIPPQVCGEARCG